MTLDETIKLQGELLTLLAEVGLDKYKASTKLGIQALYLIKTYRSDPYHRPVLPLKGETI